MSKGLRGLGTAAVLLASAGAISGLARAAELYAPETLERYFKLEWARAGRNVNGYVYNTGDRRAAHMILLVEGLDGDGKPVAKTTTSGCGTCRPTTAPSSRSPSRPRQPIGSPSSPSTGSKTVWIAARPGRAQTAGSPAVTAMHWPERFFAASLQR